MDELYQRLSAVVDPLEKLNAIIPWLMFKILVLQALYDLPDDQAKFVIQDRLSFIRFLGLGLADRVPDAKTIWLFRESLVRAGAIESLFACFDKHLAKSGYLAQGGQIVDATIVKAPNQRNNEGEKEAIRRGEVPEGRQDKPAKLAQKDRVCAFDGDIFQGQEA